MYSCNVTLPLPHQRLDSFLHPLESRWPRPVTALSYKIWSTCGIYNMAHLNIEHVWKAFWSFAKIEPTLKLFCRSKQWVTCACVYAQWHRTLCDSMDCSLPGSFVGGLFQAGILERVAIFYFRRYFRPKDRTCISCIGRWIFYLGSPKEWIN